MQIKVQIKLKQAPVGTGMSRARNSRWALHMNEAGIYGSQNKIGVHIYHVGIAYIHDNLSKWHMIVGAAHKVVPISENQRRKYKLNTTSGGGYMEAMVKTK